MPIKQANITNDLLTRSVTDVVPQDLAEMKLGGRKKLRVYFGIDPTGDKLHLGHAVPLRKLKAFQEAGHEVILVIGSFTAMIGDPSGREEAREPLTEEQVKKNFATYKKQVQKVIDLNKVRVEFNHEWLGKLKPKDILELASKFSVQQLLERDMFRERQKKQQPIFVHELMYPLLVGYDSVKLDVDCEIGGNDQLFNMLCGRTLQQIYKKRDKFVLTTKLLEGTDGRKMSKTYNNAVYLTDEPKEMYGKVMSIKDELIVPYFEMCTGLSMDEIGGVGSALKKGENPKLYKEKLAREIVEIYHGDGPSKAAEEEFEQVHKNKELPSDMPVVSVPGNKKNIPIRDLLIHARFANSKSAAQRLVEQGGVKYNGKIVDNWRKSIEVKRGAVLQVGSRKFVKLT